MACVWARSEEACDRTGRAIKSQIFFQKNLDLSKPRCGLRMGEEKGSLMRAFYSSYEIVQKASGQLENSPDFCLNIPWWHNIVLIEKVKNLEERKWYAHKAVESGWSWVVMEMWIDSDLYHRQGKAPNNFQKALLPQYKAETC